MMYPRLDDLLENVDSRYALVIVAAKRARQINNYHHQLGEGMVEDFVGALTFEALAGSVSAGGLYPHLVDADLLVVAPLTANTLAKLAHGIADNVLTQLGLAFPGPRLPA